MVIKVLIAEDSAFQRKIITDMLSENDVIEVVGQARNGREAIEMVETLQPDVLVLDIIMPEMDGLTAFKHIIQHHPIPTIVFSVLDPISTDDSIQALLIGAFDYLIKPGGVWKDEFPKFREELIKKVLLASKSKVREVDAEIEDIEVDKKFTKEFPRSLYKKKNGARKPLPDNWEEMINVKPLKTVRLDTNAVVIGASVGGPGTIKGILKKLPAEFPAPVFIVQHINAEFCSVFARALQSACQIRVKVGEDGEMVEPGTVYIAPGEKHMEISVSQRRPCIKTYFGEPVNYCIPSIDVLFLSAAKVYGGNLMSIILTGMGEDGVAGMGAIQKLGGVTITESKETCVLYGIPKIAAQRGIADYILPNYEIKDRMIEYANKLLYNYNV
ncbi:MAG: chemotaxis-specific protein-glutamate methyltransferase CheB [Candidatus Hodarchaeota archaeon]